LAGAAHGEVADAHRGKIRLHGTQEPTVVHHVARRAHGGEEPADGPEESAGGARHGVVTVPDAIHCAPARAPPCVAAHGMGVPSPAAAAATARLIAARWSSVKRSVSSTASRNV